MSPNVLISDALSPAAVQIFKDRGIEVDFQPKLGADKERLAQVIGEFDGLAIRSATKVTPKILEMAKRLKVIGRAGIGVDNVDIPAATAKGVIVMFKLPADFPAGGISNVPGILMKQAEQTRGVPLAGLAVKVTPGFYLIGLSNAEADKDRNIQLLKERSWFDIPVVYNNNRRAILALEKGTPGEQVFADAFKAWKQ